jgi:hypothetical protein
MELPHLSDASVSHSQGITLDVLDEVLTLLGDTLICGGGAPEHNSDLQLPPSRLRPWGRPDAV